MIPFDHNLVFLVVALQNHDFDYLEKTDEIEYALEKVLGKCKNKETETLVWLNLITKCLEYPMPEHYRIDLEKISEGLSSFNHSLKVP